VCPPAVDFEQLRELAGEAGGSLRVSLSDLERLLAAAPPAATSAGGSAANTLRGLAAGFAVPCGVVGAVGGDDWGRSFAASLEAAGVSTSLLQVDADKSTGRCAVLVTPDGQRTMRTALAGAASLSAAQVREGAAGFDGVQWLSLTAFAFYCPGLVDAVVDVSRASGARLIFHLASFEVVRAFFPQVRDLLASGDVAVVFGNEDEARELMCGHGIPADVAADPGAWPRRAVRCACGERAHRVHHTLSSLTATHRNAAPVRLCAEVALRRMAETCSTAVVTLGSHGCLAMQGDVLVHESAVAGVQCVDSTGAGDLFAAGFMFGLINDLTLQSCVRLGCLSGAAVVKVCVPCMLFGFCVCPVGCCSAAAERFPASTPHRAMARR
jgi:sugar/nucleoside kinase (ribokinase family)